MVGTYTIFGYDLHMQALRLALLTVAAAALAFGDGITGKWTGEINTPNGAMQLTIEFKADGETLTGTVGTQMGEMPIKEGKVKGDELSWVTTFERDGNSMRILNKAKVSGTEMKVVTSVEGREDRSFEYTARKGS
jgi:hypothetical protein